MAMIQDGGASHARTRGRPIRKRSRSYVDMTAMVDVAFLLLTFFVLSAVISKDYVLDFFPPPKDGGIVDQREELVLSVILDKNNKVYYYTGVTDPEVHSSWMGSSVFRTALQQHIHSDEKASVLIKARDSIKYGMLIDMFDELLITGANRHALAPFTEADSLLIYAQNP
jgi:biopolymer transport protein ExbD